MSKFRTLLPFILTIIVGVAQGQGPTCPAAPEISPCTCTKIDSETKIVCSDTFQTRSIRQSDIDRTFLLLRQINSQPSIVLHRVEIYAQSIQELNLSPLLDFTIKSLDITDLSNLHRIHVTSSQVNITGTSGISNNISDSSGVIDVSEIRIRGTALTNSGLENIFPYLSSNLTTLALRLNNLSSTRFNIRDDAGDIEFLPGFSRFTKLKELYLGYFSRPALISGGQFKRNRNLQYIDLSSSQSLSLGPSAFIMDLPSPPFGDDEFLSINLSDNNFTDDSFSSGDPPMGLSCFQGTNRATTIDLSFNSLESLSANHFQRFLRENENNTLYASGNKFVCGDQRMKWLQDGRTQFQTQVTGVFCRNDPMGGTIFNTNLTAV